MDYPDYEIVYTEHFYRTLEGIHRYIKEHFFSQETADKRVQEILKSVERLKLFPEAGFDADQKIGRRINPQYPTRGYAFLEYLIFYYIDETDKKVYVTHLISSRSHYIDLFD